MTQHLQADILRAIAAGENLQFKETDNRWLGIGWEQALEAISESQPIELRIKPKTMSINGREFECPVPANSPNSHYSVEIFNTSTGGRRAFWHDTKEARDLHYKILVEESTLK